MARSPRMDAPGRFHHVFNRAARRQVLFADRSDYRYFIMLLACAVRRGELVVQDYCLMSTHFHLLAASPDGRLSYALMRIQNGAPRQDIPAFLYEFSTTGALCGLGPRNTAEPRSVRARSVGRIWPLRRFSSALAKRWPHLASPLAPSSTRSAAPRSVLLQSSGTSLLPGRLQLRGDLLAASEVDLVRRLPFEGRVRHALVVLSHVN